MEALLFEIPGQLSQMMDALVVNFIFMLQSHRIASIHQRPAIKFNRKNKWKKLRFQSEGKQKS